MGRASSRQMPHYVGLNSGQMPGGCPGGGGGGGMIALGIDRYIILQPLDDKHVMFNTKLGHHCIVTYPRFFSANFHVTSGGFFRKHFLIYIISVLLKMTKLKQEMLLQLVITTDF